MKITHKVALLSLVSLLPLGAASLTLDNIVPGSGVLLFDNAGMPLTEGRISLFAGSSPTTFDAALALAGTTSLGSITLGPATSLPGGLFAGSITTPNAGELNNADLFLLISNVSGTEFGAYDLAGVFTKADTPPPASSVTESLNNSSLITLADARSGEFVGDFSPINAGQAPAFRMQLAAIPEPSSFFLVGIALAGGVVRRRR